MGSVLHRTTKEYLVSVNTPDYSDVDWIINPNLSNVVGVDPKFWVISEDTVNEMTSEEKDTAHLASHKAEKCIAVDVRTDELIAQGFIYSDKTFSLSNQAQNQLMGTHQARDDIAMTYPLKWNTIDDTDVIELADTTDLHNFYLQALGTYRVHVDGGTALKDQVRAATTIAAVDIIVDSR